MKTSHVFRYIKMKDICNKWLYNKIFPIFHRWQNPYVQNLGYQEGEPAVLLQQQYQ